MGYSGKHVGKDVEMKLLVKQKQNTFLPKQERRHYEPQRMSAQARYNEPITAVNDQQYAISVALQ